MTSKRVAWVFAGGGSLGAVQVGMLAALVKHGIKPDFVVGASVGAINCAHYAGRPDREGVAALRGIWLGIRQEDVFPISLRTTLTSIVRHRNYLIDPSGLERLISSKLPFRDFKDAKVPCHVVATDIYTGYDITFSEGDAHKAILASAAIPSVFPAVRYDDRFLVDGGVASNTPVSAAVALGATRVIVLPTGFSCSISEPPRTIVATALHALNLMIMKQLVRDTEFCAAKAESVVVPPLCPVEVTPYDFSQTRSLIERAERSTIEWLAKGGLGRANDIPHTLYPHHDGDEGDYPHV